MRYTRNDRNSSHALALATIVVQPRGSQQYQPSIIIMWQSDVTHVSFGMRCEVTHVLSVIVHCAS